MRQGCGGRGLRHNRSGTGHRFFPRCESDSSRFPGRRPHGLRVRSLCRGRSRSRRGRWRFPRRRGHRCGCRGSPTFGFAMQLGNRDGLFPAQCFIKGQIEILFTAGRRILLSRLQRRLGLSRMRRQGQQAVPDYSRDARGKLLRIGLHVLPDKYPQEKHGDQQQGHPADKQDNPQLAQPEFKHVPVFRCHGFFVKAATFFPGRRPRVSSVRSAEP